MIVILTGKELDLNVFIGDSSGRKELVGKLLDLKFETRILVEDLDVQAVIQKATDLLTQNSLVVLDLFYHSKLDEAYEYHYKKYDNDLLVITQSLEVIDTILFSETENDVYLLRCNDKPRIFEKEFLVRVRSNLGQDVR